MIHIQFQSPLMNVPLLLESEKNDMFLIHMCPPLDLAVGC